MKKEKLIVRDISYDNARNYLHNLKDPFLKKLFTSFTGGTFGTDQIKEWIIKGHENKKFSGLMFWFYVNEEHGITDFSLVMEPKFGFDYEDEILRNSNLKSWRPTFHDLLFFPGQRFGENIYDLSSEAKLIRLKSHAFKQDLDDVKADIVIVNEGIEKFLTDDKYQLFNSAPFAYFNLLDWDGRIPRKKVDFFKLFFSQGYIKGIRYYFGFDSNEAPYNVRLIIVPVGIGGKNFVKYQKEKSVLLQYSWPPNTSIG